MIDMVSYGVVYGLLVVCALAWIIMPITWTIGTFVEKVTESSAKGMQAEEYIVGEEASYVNLFGGKIRFHEGWLLASFVFFVILSAYCLVPSHKHLQVGYVQGLSNIAMCVHTAVSNVIILLLSYFVLIRVSRFVYKMSVRIKNLEGKI